MFNHQILKIGRCPVHLIFEVEYQNCRRTLDVYLLFAIWMVQNSIKTDLHISNWPVWKLQVCNYV